LFLKFIIFILILITPSTSYSIDRCREYIIEVRNQHIRYFGPSFPWWYGLGQLKQESCCRSSVTAFDAGMGIAQFMPSTHKYVEKLMGVKLDPYNPANAIRMQAFYMSTIHKQNKFKDKKLWLTYQAYNGGWKLLYVESARAQSEKWLPMRESCQRKTIKLKSGSLLNFCDVNYDYSKKVFKYGNLYRVTKDGQEYW